MIKSKKLRIFKKLRILLKENDSKYLDGGDEKRGLWYCFRNRKEDFTMNNRYTLNN